MLGIPKAEMSFGYIKIGTYLPLDKTSPQPESVCLIISGVCPLFGSTEDRAYLIAPVERLAVIYRSADTPLYPRRTRPKSVPRIGRSESISPAASGKGVGDF